MEGIWGMIRMAFLGHSHGDHNDRRHPRSTLNLLALPPDFAACCFEIHLDSLHNRSKVTKRDDLVSLLRRRVSSRIHLADRSKSTRQRRSRNGS